MIVIINWSNFLVGIRMRSLCSVWQVTRWSMKLQVIVDCNELVYSWVYFPSHSCSRGILFLLLLPINTFIFYGLIQFIVQNYESGTSALIWRIYRELVCVSISNVSSAHRMQNSKQYRQFTFQNLLNVLGSSEVTTLFSFLGLLMCYSMKEENIFDGKWFFLGKFKGNWDFYCFLQWKRKWKWISWKWK